MRKEKLVHQRKENGQGQKYQYSRNKHFQNSVPLYIQLSITFYFIAASQQI